MPSQSLVDAHCHIDLLNDWQDVISRLENRGQFTLAVTTTPKAWAVEQKFAQHYKYVKIGVGLHPQVLHERMAELPLLERAIGVSRFVGEVGLDGAPAHKGHFPDQLRTLRRVFSICSEVGERVLSLHSVRSAELLLDMIEQSKVHERNIIILHWFTGSALELRRALSMGALISVNADMLRSEKGRLHARTAGPMHTLTESDFPFTKSHSLADGVPSVEPAIKSLAECWGVPLPVASNSVARLAQRAWWQNVT